MGQREDWAEEDLFPGRTRYQSWTACRKITGGPGVIRELIVLKIKLLSNK